MRTTHNAQRTTHNAQLNKNNFCHGKSQVFFQKSSNFSNRLQRKLYAVTAVILCLTSAGFAQGSLVGDWKHGNYPSRVMRFTADGKFHLSDDGGKSYGVGVAYSVSGDEVTLPGITTMIFKFAISVNTLTISGAVTEGGIPLDNLNGTYTRHFGVPQTGLPTLTSSTLLTIIFALLSIVLWSCVIVKVKVKVKNQNTRT